MERPTSVTVFGVLNIVFGVLGLCCAAQQGVSSFVPQPDNQTEIARLVEHNTGFRIYMIALTGIGAIASIAIIAAGIGLVTNQRWGRTISISWGVYACIMTVVATAVSMLVMAPALSKDVANELAKNPTMNLPPSTIESAVSGILCCSGVFNLIYPVLLLIFMFRPNVIAFFRGDTALTAESEPWDGQLPMQ